MADAAEVTPALPAFGDLLRRYRLAAGLTQEALAAQARLSARAISDLERGIKHTPRRDTLALLAGALRLAPQARAAFEAAARPGASPGRPHPWPSTPSGGVLAPALVGRAREVALLERHLGGEGPPLLLLAGEPGIGKSRLLREAMSRAPGWGLRVLSGGCQRRAGQEPYAPILEALERHLHGQPAAQRRTELEGCTWLARLLPELAGSGTAPMPLWTLPADQERRLMFKAVGRLLANAAGPGGTLLVLDDLQWAGGDALDLLATLARGVPEVQLRVVGAYRDTEVQAADPLALLLADLAHAGLAAHQTVTPLPAEDAALLLEDMLGSTVTEGDRVLRDQMLQRTGGVPFFLVSCAQAMGLRDQRDGSENAIPWDVQQGVRQRVSVLPRAVRELVGAASVVGRMVSRPLLLEVVAQPELEAIAGLEVACRARLLEEAGEDAYRFAHDVIHEVVRGDLGAAQRAALHRRAAEALERRTAAPPVELLAYHYERAGELERALAYLVTAAERARERIAYRDEVDLLARAIGLAERLGQRGRVAELQALRGKAFDNGEMWLEARTEFEAALAGLEPECIEQRAEVLVNLAKVYWWSLDCMTSGRYAGQAFELAESAGREDLAASALAWMAQAHKSEGRLMHSRTLCARGLARSGGATNPMLLWTAPHVHYLVGNVGEAIRLGRDAVDAIRETKDAGTTVTAMANLGLALGAGGHYAEAIRVFEEARRIGDEYEIRTQLSRTVACSTGLHLDVFDYIGAEVRATAAYEMARSANWPPAMVSSGIDLLCLFARSGEVGRAEALVDEVVRLSELPGSFHAWGWRLRVTEARAEIALARGDWEQARHWATYSLRHSRISRRTKYQVLALGTRAQAFTAMGQVKDALTDLRRAVKLARLVGDPAQFVRIAALLLRLDGDDLLDAEARSAADRIVAALPDETMRRRFRESAVVRSLRGH